VSDNQSDRASASARDHAPDTARSGAAERPDLAALSQWAPELAKTFVTLASDIALVIDDDGVIRNVAQGHTEPLAPSANDWIGRAWIDTVSGETRPKIANLLKEVVATGIARRREVNHPLGSDASIPVAYTAIRLGENGPVLAVGRDLRTIAAIQQRFVESQQDLERGYWQARQSEARYQLLFQVATDAVIVIDSETFLIAEANQAAATLFGCTPDQLQGRHASFAFEHHSRGAINELLGSARSSGKSGEIRARLQGSSTTASVSATPFRADDAMRMLVRVRALETGSSTASVTKTLARLVDGSSDGVVVTDSSGKILIANPAFLALVRLSNEAEVKGKPLMSWLGLVSEPFAALIPKVRRDGIARHVGSWIKPADAAPQRIEVSAALLTEGDQECIGFTMHPVAADRHDAAHNDGLQTNGSSRADEGASRALRAGIELISAQLGALELSEMLIQVGALAERHFVELALQRSHGDIDATARMLGMSRSAVAALMAQPDES
jgi:transcriptional regulator PpsR